MTDRIQGQRRTDSHSNLDAAHADPPAPKVSPQTSKTASKPLPVDAGASDRKRTAEYAKAQAAYAATKRTLEAHPEQADRLIAERLAGRSAEDREIVAFVVARRGNTGIRRYADAEEVLRTLPLFSKEERADILGIMKAGASFANAVKDERAELARTEKPSPKATATSLEALRNRAIANIRERAANVGKLSAHVGRLSHQIGKLTDTAEIAVGVGSAYGLPGAAAVALGESLATGSSKPLVKVLDRAEDAGGLIAGKLTSLIAAADKTTVAYFKAADAFSTAKNDFERATRNGDPEGAAKAGKSMDAATKQLTKQAASLVAQAKVIEKWNHKFEHAAVEASITVVTSAAGAGLEFAELGHPVASVAGAVVKDGMRERVVGAGVEAARDGSQH